MHGLDRGAHCGGIKMLTIDQVHEAIREAMRNNPDGLRLAALVLTERQRFELMRDAPAHHWQLFGAVKKYNGLAVITAPDLVFYTPRILMGDH